MENENESETTIAPSIIIRKRRQVFSSVVSTPETFYVHNLTHLRPMTALLYRVRSKNLEGLSEWSPISSISTLDAPESESELISAPESVQYFFDEKKLIVQVYLQLIFYFEILNFIK